MRTAIVLLLLVGCKASHDAHEEPHADAGTDRDVPAGVIAVDPEMMRDLRITTAAAESRPGGEAVTVLGEVGVNEDAYAEIGSLVAARAVKLLAAPGDTVRAGQPLVELVSADLGKARAEYLSARARAELADQALARKRSLAQEQIAPQRELQEAEAEARAAGAAFRSARAALLALGATDEDATDARFSLRSPIAGTVLDRTVRLGQMTDPSRPLYRVADLSRLWLTVHAFERDAVRLRAGATARVAFPALPGRSFAATVALVGSQVEAASRTIPVRLDVPNEERLLRPGMSATAWLPLGDPAASLTAVPAAALQRMPEGWCVFVPRDERSFEIRTVGRGRDLGGEVEVVSGLAPGEKVVVEGAFLLKAEREKSRGEGGHHEH